jgi:hypothetical protein
VVGRFFHLTPAIWLYTFNMAALAAVGYRLTVLLPDLDDKHTLDRKVSLVFLLGTSLLCAALSPILQGRALWVYLLNFGAAAVSRWLDKKRQVSDRS